jgi:acetolactate synthase-1/2/3 large subunit
MMFALGTMPMVPVQAALGDRRRDDAAGNTGGVRARRWWFLFSAQELETATRLGLHFTHVIMRDNAHHMVAFQEILKYGRRSGVQLGDYDVTHFAAAFGAKGIRVTGMDQFEGHSNNHWVMTASPSTTCPSTTAVNTGLFAQFHDGLSNDDRTEC